MKAFLKDLFDFSEYEKAKQEAASYVLSPNLSRYFTWSDFDEENQCFEMNVGGSVAAIYELYALPTEGQPDAYLGELAQHISALFEPYVFKPYKQFEAPWVIQFYVSDDYDLSDLESTYRQACQPRAGKQPFSKTFLNLFHQHYQYLQRSGGIFEDPMSHSVFKGRARRIRMVIYRRLHGKVKFEKNQTPEKDLNNTCISIENLFRNLRIRFHRLNEADFHDWLFRWLSPKPPGFDSADDYLASVSFPTPDQKPIGFDLTQSVFSSPPKSDDRHGLWYFDGIPHRFIPIVGFTQLPKHGQISAERQQSKQEGGDQQRFAPLDLLPEGAVFTLTVVIHSQDAQMARQLVLQKKARKTTHIDAELAGEEAQAANRLIADGNYIFPTAMGIYIQGKDVEDIANKEQRVRAMVATYMGLKTLSNEQDSRVLDRYIRFLPMNYSYNYDSRYLYQSRLATLSQIAATVPIYGRSRGSGTPLFAFFNRLGEPIYFDPLKDKVSNSHLFIFGTTGSGKSNLSAYLLAQTMAMVLPRMVIIDAGGSFKYLVDFMKRLGVKTNVIEIRNDIAKPAFSLNPFSETKKMLAQVARLERLNQSLHDYEEELDKHYQQTTSKENETVDLENRDYLMEFVSAAILMITGSEQKELDALDRQDRYLILEAIKASAKTAVENGYEQMIPGDLAKTMRLQAESYGQSNQETDQLLAPRLAKMANGIDAFINTPLNARYFNQRGEPMPEMDLTYFELGLYKDDHQSNEAPRALAINKLLNDSMSRAEAYKDSGRPFIFYCDECHVVTSKPITAASIVQATKMGRKNNLWIWLATQNTEDFPASAARAISMIEYKLLLWSDTKERELISNFVDITPSQKKMYQSVSKAPGKYTELLLATSTQTYLCRNVPPREILALAATSDSENFTRQQLMEQFACDGVEASLLMAQKMRGEDYDLEKIREMLCSE